MQIDLSKLNISFDKKQTQIEEFDIVEDGIFQGTDSNIEFLLDNAIEVIKRFHKICEHMNKYDTDVALNKSIFTSKTIDKAKDIKEEDRTPLQKQMVENNNAMDEMLLLIENVGNEEKAFKAERQKTKKNSIRKSSGIY